MAVKDLVGIYESKVSSPSVSSRPQDSQGPRPSPPDLPSPTTSQPTRVQATLDIPSPSPARFVAHPLLRRREPSTADQEDDPILSDPPASDDTSATYVPFSADSDLGGGGRELEDADVTDELLTVSGRERSIFSRGSSRPYGSGWARKAGEDYEDADIELKALLPGSSTGSQTLRPSSSRGDTATLASNGPRSPSTITLAPTSRPLGPHTPIPLAQLIARDAAPVSLPKLDEYISTLETPRFPSYDVVEQGKGKGKAPAVSQFPPMDRLKNATLADLENNATIPPAWRNRNTIFGALLNVALGITVRIQRSSHLNLSSI